MEGVSHPSATVAYLGRRRTLSSLLNVPRSAIARAEDDLRRNSTFVEEIYQRLARDLGGRSNWPTLSPVKFPSIYTIVRIIRPETVVETGVAAGVSSAYVLQALEDNGKGVLHSIDAPGMVGGLPAGLDPGFVIPEALENRWRLHLGRSSDLLQPILAELGPIDIFMHDSEHTYDNMLWEYRTAWPALGNGGVLLSDDIRANRAFRDFTREVGARSAILYGFGAMVKKHSEASMPR